MSYRLFNSDCLQAMQLLKDKSVDMTLADLPYGTTACKWDSIIPFEPLWEQYKRVCSGPVLLFGTEPFSSLLRVSNLSSFKYDWYWQKDKAANFLFGNKMPLKVIETCSVFYTSQPTYNPQKEANPKGFQRKHLAKNPSKITANVRAVMGETWKETAMGESANYSGKDYEPDKLLPKQLVYFAREQRGKIHPTQKPVALMEYLIRTYTHEGDTVLDNTMGSGTTGVACMNTGRNFIGMEKDTENGYFEIARNRIAEAELNTF